MLIYLNKYTTQIIAFNSDIKKSEAMQYVNDEDVLWVEGLKIEEPRCNYDERVLMYYDGNKVDYVIEKIEKVDDEVSEHEKTTEEIHNGVNIMSEDSMINMDMILDLDVKITAILNHLGIDY